MDSPTDNFDSLLDKLEEVRAVFVLSKRSMPFLEEFFGFVRDVAPLIEEIDQAIRQSSGEMPQAKSQLESVSQATELATTEILDLVDAVLEDVRAIEQRRQRAAERAAERSALDERLMARLREALDADARGTDALSDADCAALLADAEAFHAERDALGAGDAEADVPDEAFAEIRQKMNRIMLSLQVQDITSQQIAGVNHLIESVRTRLTELTHRFTTGGRAPAPAPSATKDEPLTFDANARYDHEADRQQMADSLIASFGSEAAETPSADARADDAHTDDSPTGDGHAGGQAPDVSPEKTESKAESGAASPVSQDDIDALFQ